MFYNMQLVIETNILLENFPSRKTTVTAIRNTLMQIENHNLKKDLCSVLKYSI